MASKLLFSFLHSPFLRFSRFPASEDGAALLGLCLLNILSLRPTTQDTAPSPSSPVSTWLGSGWLRGLLEPERVLTGGWERGVYLLTSLVLLSLFFRGMRLLDRSLGSEARAKSRSELGVEGEETFRERMLEQAREGVELNMDELLGTTRDIWQEQGIQFVFVDHRATSPNLFASRPWLLFFATFAGFFLAHITSQRPWLHPLLALAFPSALLYLDYAHLEAFANLVSGVRPCDLLLAYLFSHSAALHELPRAHYPDRDASVQLRRLWDVETWIVLIDGPFRYCGADSADRCRSRQSRRRFSHPACTVPAQAVVEHTFPVSNDPPSRIFHRPLTDIYHGGLTFRSFFGLFRPVKSPTIHSASDDNS
ncbi:Proteophosphoglycan ppg4 [Rhodotorula toruloides ATCC 204091]|uniref:Proteophosphoglycan ppg4 n=1 Tax=Rhodotorula toruloides TaxID=5286 RepID=A0A0K3CEZ0_RHOTO|nr:Proteophosphoglycan ppg4 [Rhodotorula toruloides ATCC 204091]PRQ74459.1 Proteophosphoglycan ppg4 [Rhodotorula toruloides]